jgi:hypothetical protein
VADVTISDGADRIEAIRKATPIERKLARELLVRYKAWDIIEMLDLGEVA